MDATIKIELLKLAATQAVQTVQAILSAPPNSVKFITVNGEKMNVDLNAIDALTEHFFEQYKEHFN